MAAELAFGFAVEFHDLVSANARAAAASVRSLTAAVNKLQQASSGPPPLSGWTTAFNQTSAAAGQASQNIRGASQALGTAGRQARQGATRFDEASNSFSFLQRSFVGANVAIATGKMWEGVGAGVSALTQLTQTGMEYQQQQKILQVLLGAEGTELSKVNKLREQAISLSQRTSSSAIEVTKAQQALAQQGKKAGDILERVPTILQLAQAGFIDTEKAAFLLENTMTVFGKTVKGGPVAVADLLSKGANVTQFSMTDLSWALRQVGATSVQMGVGLEDTIGLMQLFKGTGLTAGQSGTALRNVMTDLAIPTSKASKAMARMGLTLKDLNFKDLKDGGVGAEKAFGNWTKLFGDSGVAAQAFGKATGPKLSGALSDAASRFKDFKDQMAGAAGVEAQATEQSKTMSSQWKILGNNVSALGTLFQGEFEGPIGRALFGVNNILRNFTPFLRRQFGIIVKDLLAFGEKVFQGLGPWADVLRTLSQESTEKTKDAISGALKPLALAFVILKIQVTEFLGGFVDGMKAAWAKAGPILGFVAKAVFYVMDALFGLRNPLDDNRSAAEKWGAAIGSMVVWAGSLAAGLFLLTGPMFIIGNMVKAVTFAFQALQFAGSAILFLFKGLGVALQVLRVLWLSFQAAVFLLTTPLGLVAVGLALLIFFWDDIVYGLKTTARWVEELVKDLGGLGGILKTAAEFWSAPFKELFSWIQKVWTEMDGFGGMFKTAVASWKGLADQALGGIKGAFGSVAGFFGLGKPGPGGAPATAGGAAPGNAGGSAVFPTPAPAAAPAVAGGGAPVASAPESAASKSVASMISNSTSSSTVNLSEGAIKIDARNKEPAQLAEELHDHLKRVARQRERAGAR